MAWAERAYNRDGDSRPPKIEPVLFVFAAIAVAVVYVQWRRGELGLVDIFGFIALIPSIVLHEVSHGWLANAFGDPTAKRAGRLTLNPLRHVDAWGTFIVPGFLILLGGPAFGWAKPVPVNTSQMTRNQAMFTGLIGPFTNIVIATAAALTLAAVYAGGSLNHVETFIFQLGIANVVLAVFNLIPIPPLDGSAVVERFLPQRYWNSYLKFRQYSMAILLVLMIFFNSALSLLFNPAINLWIDFVESML